MSVCKMYFHGMTVLISATLKLHAVFI